MWEAALASRLTAELGVEAGKLASPPGFSNGGKLLTCLLLRATDQSFPIYFIWVPQVLHVLLAACNLSFPP